MKKYSKLFLMFVLSLALLVGCQNDNATESEVVNSEEQATTSETEETATSEETETTEEAESTEESEVVEESEETEEASETEGANEQVTALKDVAAVNKFLNESAALGEGSKANPVAVIPINHIDGPGGEDLFYAFVNFKYVARDYIKYQITYVSCTCREASVNYWQTAYVEMTLPESGNIEDAVYQTISFDKDTGDHYTAGHWGDSDPIPNGTTYEDIKTEYIPYFIDKTVGEVNGLSTMKDIDLADYQDGEGRGEYTLDGFSGASVSTNNIIRMLLAIGQYHGTDAYFGGGEIEVVDGGEEEPADTSEEEGTAVVGTPGTTQELPDLPAPRNTENEFKANPDSDEMAPCTEDSYGVACSSINTENLIDFMGRDDVLYIDLRDYNDYSKKHFRNFEVIPYFAWIWNENAATDSSLIQLYGGTPKEPIPVYEESDKLLEVLFPKDKTLFIICQSGGRVEMLMNILAARGWDMSKIYNIGGMAQYTAPEYREYITDMPEFIIDATYNFEGLTRIAPAE